MDEKLSDSKKRVLLTTDAANPQALKAVTGLNQNGIPRTVSPDGANIADFLAIDKNGNALENFFKKFLEQTKNPAHTGFFLMTQDVLGKIIEMQPVNAKTLEPYRIEPQQCLDQRQGPKQGQARDPGGAASGQKNDYQPIDENKINWSQAATMGINRQLLEDTGQLKAMLYGHKSPALNHLTFTLEGITFDTQARLSLKEMPDGTYNIQPHCYLKTPELDKTFLGTVLSDKDKENLVTSGNAGRVVELEPTPGQKIPALVSLDKMTNRLEAVPVEKLNIPQSLKGVEFTHQQIKDLKEGKVVLVEGMITKKSQDTDNPKKFDAYIQFNAAKGSFDFSYGGLDQNRNLQENKQQQSHENEPNNVRIPQKLLGVELTPKQQEDLRADKTIYIKGMLKDGQDQPFNAYVKINQGEGKLDFYKFNPEKAKKQGAEITPASESQTQVAVNSEGKTNEATKKVNEPLKQGQSQPIGAQHKQIHKGKDMKM
ncbi:MAG: DUF3945 domain-containing protein [Bacteroidota bacterium]